MTDYSNKNIDGLCLICFIFYEQMSFVTNSDPLVKLPLDA
jgi:hypothetical protein